MFLIPVSTFRLSRVSRIVMNASLLSTLLVSAQQAAALEVGMPANAGVSASPAVMLEAQATLDNPLTLMQFAATDDVEQGLEDGTLDAAYVTPEMLKQLIDKGLALRILDGADLDDVSLVARDELIRYTELFEPRDMLVRFLNDTTRAMRVAMKDDDVRSRLALQQWVEVKVGSSMQLVSPRSLDELEGDEYAGDAPKALVNSRKIHSAFLNGDDATRLVAIHPLSKDWLPRANMLDLPRMLLVSLADTQDAALAGELDQLAAEHVRTQQALHDEDPTKIAFMLKQDWPAEAGDAPSLPRVVHALNGHSIPVADMRKALSAWLDLKDSESSSVIWPERTTPVSSAQQTPEATAHADKS